MVIRVCSISGMASNTQCRAGHIYGAAYSIRIAVSNNRAVSERRGRSIMTVKTVENNAVCQTMAGIGSVGRNVVIRRSKSRGCREVLVAGSPNRMERCVCRCELGLDINKPLGADRAVCSRISRTESYTAERHGRCSCAAVIGAGGRIQSTVAVMAGDAELLGQDVINIIRQMSGRRPRTGRIRSRELGKSE